MVMARPFLYIQTVPINSFALSNVEWDRFSEE
jgi:hypothetical protein